MHCLSINSPDSFHTFMDSLCCLYSKVCLVFQTSCTTFQGRVASHCKAQLLVLLQPLLQAPLAPQSLAQAIVLKAPAQCSPANTPACLPSRPRTFEGDCCARSVAWSRVASAWLLIIGSIRPLTADQAGLLTRWLKGRSLSDQKL